MINLPAKLTLAFALILSCVSIDRTYASNRDSDEETIKHLQSILKGSGMWLTRLPMDEIHAGTFTPERQEFLGKEESAKMGYPADMISLASFYIAGKGCTKNHQEAFNWLEKALATDAKFDAGSLALVTKLYKALDLPRHVPAIQKRIVECLQKSLDLGNKDVRLDLARTLVRLDSDEEAAELYTTLMEQEKSGEAAYCLSFLIDTDRIKFPKSRKAQRVAELIKIAAEYGYDLAIKQFMAHVFSGSTHYTDESAKKMALEIAKARVEEGKIGGYELLGKCYFKGIGLEPDPKQALDTFLAGISKGGDPNLHFLCAELYETGKLGEPDGRSAFKHYLTGAVAGDPSCMFQMGMLSEHGKYTKADRPKAIDWYRKAIAKGCREAVLNLGIALCQTNNPVDTVEAIKLFESSRAFMPFNADYMLAHCHYKGIGVKVDLNKALIYIEPHQQNVDAKKLMGNIYMAKQNFVRALACFEDCLKQGAVFPANFIEDVRGLAAKAQEKNNNPKVKKRNLIPLLARKAKNERIIEFMKTTVKEANELCERVVKECNENPSLWCMADHCDMLNEVSALVANLNSAATEKVPNLDKLDTDTQSLMDILTESKKKLAMAEAERQASQAWEKRRHASRRGSKEIEFSEVYAGPDLTEQREAKKAAMVRIKSERDLKQMHDTRPNANPAGREEPVSVQAAEPIELVPGPFAKTELVKSVQADIEGELKQRALIIRDQVRLAQNDGDLVDRLRDLGTGYKFKDLSETKYAGEYQAHKLYQLRINGKYRVFVPLRLIDGMWIVVNNSVCIVQPHKG